MKFCEREDCRCAHKGTPSVDVQAQCNRVECVDADGNVCQCWMEFPKNQPHHDKTATIRIDDRHDEGVNANYYGISVLVMGAVGIVLFLVLWARELGLF